MIVSHRHRFIYLKTRRTGSTSVEIALADQCGPDDIVTRMNGARTRIDPKRRINWQNDEIPTEQWPLAARLKVKLGKTKRQAGVEFFNHVRARRVRMLIGAEVFDAYHKVSIERNPWDREVSFYFFSHRDPARRPPFRDFVLALGLTRKPIDNFDIYSLDGRVVADTLMRFETLGDDFTAFATRLGLDPVPALPRANTNSPRKARAYRDLYEADTREHIRAVYRREIELLGYDF